MLEVFIVSIDTPCFAQNVITLKRLMASANKWTPIKRRYYSRNRH